MKLSSDSSFRVDVSANRRSIKWSRRELVGRMLWGVGSLVFALIPRPAWGARRVILRMFGAKVSVGAHIYPSVRIMMPWNLKIGHHAAVGDRVTLYALGPITIGDRATISAEAYLCAGSHNYRCPTMPLIKSPIVIGADAWICAGAFVGPGVSVGERAILGARGVAMGDIPEGMIFAGNPALWVKARESFAPTPVSEGT